MIFSAIGAVIGAVTTFIGGLGAIGTFALQMAASVGLSYLAKAIAGKKQQSSTPSTMGVQGTLQSGGDVPRSFVMGKGATAGSLVYANTWGNDGSTPNAYLTQVIALSDLPVKGLLEVWVNGEKCTRGDTAHLEFGYPVLEYRKDGKDHLWIKFYDGTQTAADGFLTSKVGSAERPYESTRVGKGVAYAICTSLVEDTLFTGFPQFIFGLDGIRCYDPSRDDTAGGAGDQRYSDPATWGGDGDDLPAVQVYNLLRGLFYGGQWFYGLQGVTAARLPAANWIAQINKCRAGVDLGEDETEPAYRSGGQIVISAQLGDAIESLLTACQGKLAEIGGLYKIYLGAPDSPAFAFSDDDIILTAEQSFTPFFGLSDTITGVAAKYPEPAEAWAMKPAPPLYRTDLDAKAGNRRLMADVSLDFVPYSAQAQRLMQSALLAAQRARRHTFTLPPSFWFVEPGDVGEWTSARNGYASKLFEVNGAVDKANLDVTVDLTEVDPEDFEWDFATDFTPTTTGSTVFPRPAAQPIIDWYVEPAIIKDSDGIARRPAIRLSWDGEMPGVIGVQYEVRLKSDGSEVARGRTDQLEAAALLISQGLLPATQYQSRGRYIPGSPRDTIWSDWLDVTTPDVRLTVIDFNEALKRQVTSLLDDQFADARKRIAQLATAVQQALARTSIDKREVRAQLAARSDNALAEISRVEQVAVTAGEAVADLQETVGAEFAGVAATVTEHSSAIATLEGYAAAQWSVLTDANGNVAGLILINGGSSKATFDVIVNTFRVCFPGSAGGDPVPVYTIGNVGGIAKVALRGDMLVDGSIITQMIAAGSITSVTIQAGAINTTQLAINSVDINNIIAGAVTKVDFSTTAAGFSGVLASRTVNIKSGLATIVWCATHASAVVGGSDAPTTDFGLYVDGTRVKLWSWTMVASSGGTWSLADPFTAQWSVSGLSSGDHVFEIKPENGRSVAAGQMYITDFRR